MKKIYQIPFCLDKHGCEIMQSYPETYSFGFKWKDNYVFQANLDIVEFGRGRSSAVFYLEDKVSGSRYSMFMSDMLDVLKNCNIQQGKVSGSWTFCKKGSNYGLKRSS